MTKQPYVSGKPRPKGAGTVGRAEQITDDDRPFAEVRKTVHDALRMLAQHRWGFFVPFSVVTCAAFILSLYYPRTYQARTTFERRNDPVMMNLPMSSGAASFKYFRNTMVRDLTSVDYLREVVDNLGFTKNAARTADGELTAEAKGARDAIARSLAARLDVSTVSPSQQIDIITITYTGPDPNIGRRLVDEAKRTYIRRTMVWIQQYLIDQRDYFKREGELAHAEVREAQRKEEEFRSANPHADPTNPGALTLKIAQLEMEHRGLVSRRRDYQSELAALKQQLIHPASQTGMDTGGDEEDMERDADTGSETLWVSPEAIRLADEIRKADTDLDKLIRLRGMTTEHPEAQRVIARRQRLESEWKRQREYDRTHPRPANLPSDLASTQLTMAGVMGVAALSERTRLLGAIASQRSRIKDVQISLRSNEEVTAELAEAQRGMLETREEFAELLSSVARTKKRQSRAEQTVGMIEPAITAVQQNRLLQFSEGSPASGSIRPISPKSGTIVLLALLAGVATGVLFIVLAEVFDNVYRNSSQVARSLGLPMLETIDEIVTSDDRRYIFLRKVVLSPLVVACFVGLTVLTGSMAYLSIERPWTYQRISKIPHAVMDLFAGDGLSDG